MLSYVRYQCQNIFGPLLKLEGDYDKKLKKSQTQDSIQVRWYVGLNMAQNDDFVDVALRTHHALQNLNRSQVYAVEHMLQRPLSFIQGHTGLDKTVTRATILYHLVKQDNGLVLVWAPSNTVVDQLCMKVHKTGQKFVRVCGKSMKAWETPLTHLDLHVYSDKEGGGQVEGSLELKLFNEETGELSNSDGER